MRKLSSVIFGNILWKILRNSSDASLSIKIFWASFLETGTYRGPVTFKQSYYILEEKNIGLFENDTRDCLGGKTIFLPNSFGTVLDVNKSKDRIFFETFTISHSFTNTYTRYSQNIIFVVNVSCQVYVS